MPEAAVATPAAGSPAGAAPSPQATSTPADGTPPASGSALADGFAELEALASKPADETKPEAGKETPEPEGEEKPEAKPGEKPEGREKTEDGKPTRAAELRAAYEAATTRLKALETELNTVKTQADKSPEVSRLKEQLQAREKRLEELETEFKFTNFERSSEYKEKYEKPMQDAFRAAYAEVGELTLADANGQERQATAADFTTLMRMNLKDAISKAKEWFGDAAPEILAHRRKILELNRSRTEAIEDYRKNGADRERKAQEAQSQQRERVIKLWDEENKSVAEKFPQWFKPEEGDKDPEGNKMLEDGYRMADAAFMESNLTPEQRVRVEAMVRHRAAGFGRVVHRLNKAQARITELEKELAAFRSSEPGKGDGGKADPGGMPSIEDELNKLAAANG